MMWYWWVLITIGGLIILYVLIHIILFVLYIFVWSHLEKERKGLCKYYMLDEQEDELEKWL
jgi:hypothetical protein